MTTTKDQNQGPVVTGTTWEIDPKASQVAFTARQRLLFVMKITVHGAFTDVSGTLTVDEREPTNSRVNVTIGTASLDTKLAGRDKHLRSADFFEVERYPTLTFTSQRIEVLDQAAGHYHVTGMLTIRDIAREVSLDAWNIPVQEQGERSRLKFRLAALLNRRDFGLVWSRPIQQIADDVDIALNVEFTPVSPAL